MKIALVTDTHWGIRNDSPVYAKYIAKFFKEKFWPYVDEHDIKHIIHLGDVFDRRKYVNYQTARNFHNDFMEPAMYRNIELDVIIGNHDTYYKNTNDVNSMRELYGHVEWDNLNLHWEPRTKRFNDNCDVLLMPWICKDNYDQCMQEIQDTKAQVCFGHLELDGFEMMRGHVRTQGGMSPTVFNKFDLVASGHYHHKSTRGNVNYLGTAYELFWSDWNDPKGFHVFDTDTRELEFIRNDDLLFHKIWYNDADKSIDEILDVDFESFKDRYVKVIVSNKSNPYWFDLFAGRLDNVSPANVQVVDDHLNLDLDDDSDIIDEAEDTMTILGKYIESLDSNVDKEALQKTIGALYSEALSIQ